MGCCSFDEVMDLPCVVEVVAGVVKEVGCCVLATGSKLLVVVASVGWVLLGSYVKN